MGSRIAVVGSGVSGLVAAHHLSAGHEVTVFEAAGRVGGHTNTIDVEADGRTWAVDTGFIVFNDRTYPEFEALLGRLGVPSHDSTMSFSVRSERTGLEYNGTDLNRLFAQRRNLFSPRFLGMLRDILRFHREAPRALETGGDDAAGPTLGEFLGERRYGDAFVRDYLLPMGGAIWSATRERMLAFPLRYFVRFFVNHGMLTVDDRPTWRVVSGGSNRYLAPLCRPFAERIRLSTPVRRVRRTETLVEVTLDGGCTETFDEILLACHSDTALSLLADPSEAEREVLSALEYQPNGAVLHTDESVMPRNRRAWAAWNYHLLEREAGPALDGSSEEARAPATVTYWMNLLQGLDARTQFFVTLNRRADIDPARILAEIPYEHPIYTKAGVRAQGRWIEISGVRRTHYCGAYWGWGFHEDGVRSGLRVARQLEGAPA